MLHVAAEALWILQDTGDLYLDLYNISDKYLYKRVSRKLSKDKGPKNEEGKGRD